MSSTDDLMQKLEESIHNLLVANNKLKRNNKELENKVDLLNKALVQSKEDITILENKNKEMKIVSALSGNAEHKRLMKHKLNSLIKEVDLCIAGVKKKSI